MSDVHSEQWRLREHLHRCPKCLRYRDCGGNKAHPCGKPYLYPCREGKCDFEGLTLRMERDYSDYDGYDD